MSDAPPDREEVVLVLAPTPKDADLCRSILAEAGVDCEVCLSLPDICRRIAAGAGAAVLTEETLARPEFVQLVETIQRQPAWSDFPLLVLTQAGADSEVVLATLEILGNVTLLERPVRVPALVSSVRAALRARRRQYQIRGHLAEREQTAEALRAAARRKDEFLATLAHELRNPLAPIRNAVTILRAKPPADAQVRWCRDVIDRQVGQMTRLLDDLLDVSRITRGKLALRRERVELAAVVDTAVEAARPLIEANAHELSVALPDEPVMLDADPVRLAQVLSNLLTNAAKYTPRGGHICLTATRDGADSVVTVRDSGIGIACEHLPRLFEIFSQVDSALERSEGGLGIGLSLVKGLVEMHGGTVTARSDGPGRGSEFVVRLPVVAADARPTRAGDGRNGTPAARTRYRILVADDNRDSADSLALMLEVAGHEAYTVYGGEEAVRAAADVRPQVVLLDIGMPKVNGYEAARRIRAEPWGRDALLVAQTGWGQEEDRRRTREAGFDHHLVKPVDPDEVIALLNGSARAGSLATRADSAG